MSTLPEHTSTPPPPSAAPGDAPPEPPTDKPTWSPWMTATGFLCVVAIVVVAANILVLAGADEDAQSTDLMLQAVLAAALIAVPFLLAGGKAGFRATAHRLGLRRFELNWAGWGVVALVAFVVFLIPYTVLVQPDKQTTVETIADQTQFGTLVVFFLLVVIAAPISEELFFRGFFFGGLRGRLSFWPAAIISGLVFGALHVPSGAAQAPALAVFGVTLAWLYEESGSLGPGILAHMLLNWNAFLLAATGH